MVDPKVIFLSPPPSFTPWCFPCVRCYPGHRDICAFPENFRISVVDTNELLTCIYKGGHSYSYYFFRARPYNWALQKFLRSEGSRTRKARKFSPLTPEVTAKRLSWAIARKNWTAAEFEGFIFSDECIVEKGNTRDGRDRPALYMYMFP